MTEEQLETLRKKYIEVDYVHAGQWGKDHIDAEGDIWFLLEEALRLQDLIYQVTAAWATRVISFEHNEAMVDFAPAEELDRLLPITDEYIARFNKEGHKLWNP